MCAFVVVVFRFQCLGNIAVTFLCENLFKYEQNKSERKKKWEKKRNWWKERGEIFNKNATLVSTEWWRNASITCECHWTMLHYMFNCLRSHSHIHRFCSNEAHFFFRLLIHLKQTKRVRDSDRILNDNFSPLPYESTIIEIAELELESCSDLHSMVAWEEKVCVCVLMHAVDGHWNWLRWANSQFINIWNATTCANFNYFCCLHFSLNLSLLLVRLPASCNMHSAHTPSKFKSKHRSFRKKKQKEIKPSSQNWISFGSLIAHFRNEWI